MTHDEVCARLSALIDGALEAREAADVAAHLDGCAPCRAEFAHLRATVTMLREVDPVQAPEGFAAAVRGRLEQLGPVRQPAWGRLRALWPPTRWSWKTAAAAAAVAVVGIFAVNLVRDAAPIGRRQVGFEGTPLTRDGTAKTIMPRPGSEPVPLGGAGDQARDRAVAQPPGDVAQFRRVIRTGHVAIEVEVFDDAARRLLAIRSRWSRRRRRPPAGSGTSIGRSRASSRLFSRRFVTCSPRWKGWRRLPPGCCRWLRYPHISCILDLDS